MPTYDDFPTFNEGLVSVKYPTMTYERAGVDVKFENGWTATRVLDHAGRWSEFTVIMVLRQEDYQTVLDFLTAHELRNIPFRFTHRYLGTAIARYALWKLPIGVEIDGNPAWFRVELPMEGLF